MKSVIETIKVRKSIRTYDERQIEASKLEELKEFLKTNTKGPFGGDVRFEIVDASDYDKSQLKKLGTYGMLKGPRLFIAGAVKKGERAMEDFGYAMEKNILKATEFGLGTVWLGGSLNRSTFAEKISATENEFIPAVTPIGYAADNVSGKDKLVRFVAGADKRKPFGELFFNSDFSTPMEGKACGKYATVLEAVRLAPSASNKQPWRIIKEGGKNVYHIFFKENSFYNNILGEIKIQEIDMGIAVAHFELAARELGLEGSWQGVRTTIDAGSLKYIVSWVG